MNFEDLDKLLYTAGVTTQLNEARIDHPNIEYRAVDAKGETTGEITKIIADMSSYMGGTWTRLNRRFVKLKTESNRLAVLLKEVNLEITDKMQRDTFDPGDELLTREVLTKDAIFMLSKAYTHTTVKFSAKDREEMMNNMPRELVARLDFLTEEMIPDLTRAIALTIEAYSGPPITKTAKPRLTPKLKTPIPKDKYKDATKESINEDVSKLDRFNDMIGKFISQYDKKLDYVTDV